MNQTRLPEGLKGDIKVNELSETEHDETILRLLFHIRQQNIRQNRQLFDHSRPVDEYTGSPDPQPAGDYEIQPNYSSTVRVESILASLPVGITGAVLQLGRERLIPLYSGAATTTQVLVNLQGLGVMLTDNDRRVLTLTGASTTGFFIALSGWVFEWSGNA